MLGRSEGLLATADLSPRTTALVLIGFQNEYFAPTGLLHEDVAEAGGPARVLGATVTLLSQLVVTELLIVAAPIAFTVGYSELQDPVGLLAAIKDRQAFRQGGPGVEPVAELQAFGARIEQVPGRRGLNAFSNTELARLLADRAIADVVVAGALTSVCVDATARAAHDRGYRVTILSDCTLGGSRTEQDLFCTRIFPLYADVITSNELLTRLGLPSREP